MGLTIGLALGSGGARGLAHAGVLEALEEAGVRADVVAGTSMGSIVGGLYAQNPDSALVWSRLEAYVRSEEFIAYWAPFVPREDNEGLDARNRLMGLYEFMQRKLIAVRTVTRPYLQTAEQLLNPLHSLFGPITFEELAIPLATVALDLVSGQCVTYTEGSLVQGIYASSCIPAVFPPVEEDGRIIVDGGGPYRVPIEACRQLGADFVIAVDIPAFQEQAEPVLLRHGGLRHHPGRDGFPLGRLRGRRGLPHPRLHRHAGTASPSAKRVALAAQPTLQGQKTDTEDLADDLSPPGSFTKGLARNGPAASEPPV